MSLKLYGAIALVVVAALGAGYGLWQRSEVQELRSTVSTLENRVAGLLASEKALRKSAETSDRARRAAQDKANTAQRKLDEALKAAPDWADGAVPDGVWDALKP
jgi:hypothetical protein